MRVQLQGYIPSVRLLANTPVVVIYERNHISLFKKIMKKHDDFIYVLKYHVVFRSFYNTDTKKLSGSDIQQKKIIWL